MKLGFRFIETDREEKVLFQIGTGDWTAYTDVRNFQKAFLADNIPLKDDKSVLILYRFVPEGLLLGFSRRVIAGENLSETGYTTLWIFISSEIKISPKELKKIIETSKTMLEERRAFTDEDSFLSIAPEILSKDYQVGDIRAFLTADMDGDDFAVLESKGLDFSDIIAAGYQKVYEGFGYIIVNQSGTSLIDSPKISINSIKRPIWVFLPKEWPENIKTEDRIHVYVDKVPVGAAGGFFEPGIHTMTLSRSCFIPFQIKVEVKNGKETFGFPPQLDKIKWFKKIDSGKFHLVLEDGKEVDHGISLSSPDAYNDKGQISNSFNYGDVICVPESCLKDFHLYVTDAHYEKINETIDLTQPYRDIVLTPSKNPSNSTFEESHGTVNKDPEEEDGLSVNDFRKEINKKNNLIYLLAAGCGIFFIAFVVFLILYLTVPRDEQNQYPAATGLEQFMDYDEQTQQPAEIEVPEKSEAKPTGKELSETNSQEDPTDSLSTDSENVRTVSASPENTL